jgi:hypothetical protein
MTTTLQRLDVVQIFSSVDGLPQKWNDYSTIKEQGDEDRAISMVTREPLTYRVFGRRIVDGAPVYACVFGYAEVSAEAMKKQTEYTDKISQLLGEFEELAAAKGLDIGEVIAQYNEEDRIARIQDAAIDEAERRYFGGIDMSNLP